MNEEISPMDINSFLEKVLNVHLLDYQKELLKFGRRLHINVGRSTIRFVIVCKEVKR